MKNRFNVLLSVVALCFVYGVNGHVALAWDPLTDAGANLVAWYDASDGDTVLTSGTTFTNWLDKSANGYDLDTPLNNSLGFDGLPHINGLTAVNYGFIGYIEKTGMPDIDLANGVCLISVGQAYGGDTHHYGSASSTNGSSSIYFYENGSGTMNGYVKINSSHSNFSFVNTPSYQDGVPFMCAVYYDPAGMAYLRGNGGAHTASSARAAGATFTINGIKNGRLGNTASHYHGEMIILNTVDIDTIEKVEGYLAHKWALYSSLPTNHPYRYHAPDAPIPFGALSFSNVTTASADLSVDALTNLTSAAVVWDTTDKGTTNILVWTGSNSVSGVGSTPGTISGAATGLAEDTWYYFRFYGEDASTNGWSIEDRFATPLTANQAPQFSNAYPSSRKVLLFWSDNANTETSYVLQRATSSGGPYSDLVTLATDTTTYADTTVSAGTTYYYRLLATNSSSMTATDPSACQISATTLTAGPIVTISSTAPTTNGADIAVLSGANATDKLWTDSTGHGQTFMSSSKGGELKAVTFQCSTTNMASKTYGVRVGKMDGSSFNGIYWDSGEQTNDMSVVDLYMTVTFSVPIDLEPDTLYGVDVQMDSSTLGFTTGIPYLRYVNSNVYADGQRYTMVRGNPSTVSVGNNDRIFHLDIDLPPPAGTIFIIK